MRSACSHASSPPDDEASQTRYFRFAQARQQHVSERERKDVSTLANRDDQQERASYYERAEANVHAVLPSDLPRQVVVVRAGGA